MDEIIFKLFYNTDCCKKVVNFYKINKFYDESTFGGESIFSLNTILLHICKLLDSDEIYKKHLNIILDEKFTTKENDKLPFSINTLKKYKVENIMLSKKTIKENYNVVFGGLSSQRVGRILIIMSSDRIHDDFKRMLITYIYTIRKLGNYMPLPNKFNMNGDTSRGNRINQRKGLNYFDDPLMFYDALRIYVDDSKNAKFVNCLYNAYKFEGYDRNYEKFLEVNKLNVMYEYFSEKNIEKYYLKSLLENNLDGIYQYMFNACEIINERHKICEQEYNNLL